MFYLICLVAFSLGLQKEFKEPIVDLTSEGDTLAVFFAERAVFLNKSGEELLKIKYPGCNAVYRWNGNFVLLHFKSYNIYVLEPNTRRILSASMGEGFSFTLDPKKAQRLVIEQANFRPFIEGDSIFMFSRRRKLYVFSWPLSLVDSVFLDHEVQFVAFCKGYSYGISEKGVIYKWNREGNLIDSSQAVKYAQGLVPIGNYLFVPTNDSLLIFKQYDLDRIKGLNLPGLKSFAEAGDYLLVKSVPIFDTAVARIICLNKELEVLWEREAFRSPQFPLAYVGDTLYIGDGKWLFKIETLTGKMIDSLYIPLGKRKLSFLEKMIGKMSPFPVTDEVLIEGVCLTGNRLAVFGDKKLFIVREEKKD